MTFDNRWGVSATHCRHCAARIIKQGDAWMHVTPLGPVAKCMSAKTAEPLTTLADFPPIAASNPDRFELSATDRVFLAEMRIACGTEEIG